MEVISTSFTLRTKCGIPRARAFLKMRLSLTPKRPPVTLRTTRERTCGGGGRRRRRRINRMNKRWSRLTAVKLVCGAVRCKKSATLLE